MNYGIDPEHRKILDDLVIHPLQDQGAEIFIFGSRITNKHHPFSDVDILYRLPPDKNLPAGFLALIKEAIEESRFPYAVDLVNEKDLAESYRRNVLRQMRQIEPYFKK